MAEARDGWEDHLRPVRPTHGSAARRRRPGSPAAEHLLPAVTEGEVYALMTSVTQLQQTMSLMMDRHAALEATLDGMAADIGELVRRATDASLPSATSTARPRPAARPRPKAGSAQVRSSDPVVATAGSSALAGDVVPPPTDEVARRSRRPGSSRADRNG